MPKIQNILILGKDLNKTSALKRAFISQGIRADALMQPPRYDNYDVIFSCQDWVEEDVAKIKELAIDHPIVFLANEQDHGIEIGLDIFDAYISIKDSDSRLLKAAHKAIERRVSLGAQEDIRQAA